MFEYQDAGSQPVGSAAVRDKATFFVGGPRAPLNSWFAGRGMAQDGLAYHPPG
jgi:hypothetical protein